MSLPPGDNKGQDMPSYGAIDLAKYGKRVLLERIVRLLLAVKLSEHGWLQAYVDATRSLHGELPLCKSAIDSLKALVGKAGAAPPVTADGQVKLENMDNIKRAECFLCSACT